MRRVLPITVFGFLLFIGHAVKVASVKTAHGVVKTVHVVKKKVI